MNILYAVKTFHIYDEHEWSNHTDAIYDNIVDALLCVERNAGDLSDDGYYQYAMICPFELGLYPILEKEDQLWFEWWDDHYHATPQVPEWGDMMAFTI